MPFVERNERGEVIAMSVVPSARCDEELPGDHGDVLAFIGQVSPFEEKSRFQEADYAFIRVLEDVVELLIDKGVFMFTELPEAAQEKMNMRRGLRDRLSVKLDLIEEDL